MIDVLGIDHIVIRASDVATMVRFYEGILGCRVERDLSSDFGLIQLRAGRSLIDIVAVDSVLGRRGGPAPGDTGNNMDHFCLRIAKVDEPALTEYLESRGIAVGNFERRYGADGYGRSVYIKDPEGNVVELKSAGQEGGDR